MADKCLTEGCGATAEPGYHFCALCLDAHRPHRAPSRLAGEEGHTRIVECHPSNGPLLSAAGYRLLYERYNPVTLLVEYQIWTRDVDDDARGVPVPD